MNQRISRGVLVTTSLVAITAALTAAPAVAQTADSARGGAMIEELIVTAQKRAESEQTVPVAISAYSETELQARGIASVDDLKFQAPNLAVYSFGAGIANYSIRGLGNGNSRSATVDGSVGVFLNEVYISRAFLVNTGFLDIERVEVLRGPQGSLFGRNTTGGAISFYSTPATSTLKAKGEVTVGNYNSVSASAYVSGPISERFAAKIAATTRSRDGYNFNTTTQTDIEDEQFTGLSAQLRYTPDDKLDVALNLDTSRRRGTGDWWILYKEGPLVGRGYADPRRGNGAADNGFGNIDNTGGSLNINWKTPLGAVTAISSYRSGRLDSRTPSTGTRPAELTDTAAVKAKLSDILFTQEDDYEGFQTSQEVRLASDTDGPLHWLVGGFFFHDSMRHTRITDFRFVRFGTQGVGRFDSKGRTTAYALFANVDYDLTEALNISAGLRWSRDEKHSTEVPSGQSYSSPFRINGVNAPGGFVADARKSFDNVSPTVVVNYRVTPSAMLYARAAKGFRSGGFNDIQTEKVDAERAFNPETVWTYEGGLKSERWNHRARLNVSVFHYDYTNLQVGIIIPGTSASSPNITVTGNAGKVTNQGIEVEWEVIPLDGLSLYGNLTEQKSEIKDLIVGGVSQKGNQLPRIPRHQFLVGAMYTHSVGDFDATVRASYNRTSSFHSNPNNLPTERVPPASNLTASLTVAQADGPWSVELWGKNLQDKLNVTSLASIFNSVYAHLGTPRTYGVTIRTRY